MKTLVVVGAGALALGWWLRRRRAGRSSEMSRGWRASMIRRGNL